MGAALSAPARFLGANIDVANDILATASPTQLITFSSIATYVVLTAYNNGNSYSQSIRSWMKWSCRHGLRITCQYYAIQLAKRLPWTRKKIDVDIKKKTEDMVFQVETEWNDLLDPSARLPENRHHSLPGNKSSASDLLKLMTKWSKHECNRWNEGQASGAIYHGDAKLLEFLSQVYGLFTVANPLHPELFPYVRKMEGEIVSMMISLFHGQVKGTYNHVVNGNGSNKDQIGKKITDHEQECCGTLTSGGTESILLACKAYRDRARDLYGITEPEIIAPITIHAAFEKAAHYFGIKLVHVDIDEETSAVDVEDVRRAITRNTVLIAGSAPNFPHGIIDPIEELSNLAHDNNIGFHSDCCLGGMILPFVEKLQQLGRLDQDGESDPLPIFDFRAKGVTSLSADMVSLFS